MEQTRAQLEAERDAWKTAALACATSLRDLANGWPVRELHEPPGDSLARVERLLAAGRKKT